MTEVNMPPVTRITIESANPKVLGAVKKAISMLLSFDQDDFEFTEEVVKSRRIKQGTTALRVDGIRESKARYFYVAKFPDGKTGTELAEIITENVKTIGEGTIKARVYRGIAEATLKGEKLTEMMIRQQWCGSAGASQRIIGELGKRTFDLIEPREFGSGE